jgi:hypothetical protein
MNRLKLAGLFFATLAMTLAVAACGGDDNKAKVSFTSPAEGSTVESKFTARVSLENFELDPAAVGKAKEEGKGHLHFSLDGGKYDHPKYSGANGKLAVQLGVDGKYSPSVTPDITYQGIPAGKHTLEVFLANNDHSNAGPTASTTFTVKAGSPAVSFEAPKEGSTVGSKFTAKVALENFQIDAAAVGKAKEKGKGHLHFALDEGKYDHPKYSGANGKLAVQLGVDGKYSPSVQPRITYQNIPAGKHTLEVYLADNDHSDVGAEAKSSFTVK